MGGPIVAALFMFVAGMTIETAIRPEKRQVVYEYVSQTGNTMFPPEMRSAGRKVVGDFSSNVWGTVTAPFVNWKTKIGLSWDEYVEQLKRKANSK